MLISNVRFSQPASQPREGCSLKAREVARVESAGQLHHLLQKHRSKEELNSIVGFISADFELAKRFIHLVAQSANPQLVRAYSPIFCSLSLEIRSRLIASFKPFRSDQFTFLVGNLPAKGLRYCIPALEKLGTDDSRFCLGKLAISGNPEWLQMVREAASSPDLERLDRNQPICDEDTEHFSSLQALVYMIGSLLSSGVLVLPLHGRDPRSEYRLAGYRLSGMEFHKPFLLNGEQTKMYWVPWVFRNDSAVDEALVLLDQLLSKLSLCDEGNGFLARIEDEAEAMSAEIAERWDAIRRGVRRWLLPDGQMKLRLTGEFTYCGMLMVELHPGAKVPELSVKLVQNRFGVLKSKLRAIDADGFFADLNPEKATGLLELAINHKVVCWLHEYATRPPKSSSKNGQGEACIERAIAEGKLPPGFHLPEYMRLPNKIKKDGKPYAASDDANTKAVAYGWAEPADGFTFRMSGDPTKEGFGLREPLDIIYDV